MQQWVSSFSCKVNLITSGSSYPIHTSQAIATPQPTDKPIHIHQPHANLKNISVHSQLPVHHTQ